ncbi:MULTISPECIES: AAA family ATPase [Pseudanabaena]|uniref:AAA ATPase n=2 Tax=Pseudanabaena TaxID=1152 RepID=L8N4X5_9CYAN|nr:MULTISPECIES: AAA family ATPase [Pseudanabaena]ELS34199.1 AAA ATPase [Pseudanabaena biceps PCC 7429]MDG3493614.1 AAA family ATPase [Pseudanabaena catenata USMAC16]
MITRLEMKNFMVFRSNLAVGFSPKINVIIGENGTGKTHLLKAVYGLASGSQLFNKKLDHNNAEVSEEDLSEFLTKRFLRVFLPLENKVGKMHNTGASEKAELKADFSLDRSIKISLHNNSQTIAIQKDHNYQQYRQEPVFIPTKEVLYFMKGFVSLYQRYELSFDETYNDICVLLDLPSQRPELLHEKSKWAIAEIEKICGGRFIFYGGGNVTFKAGNVEYSANAIAEGFRKVGILARLLETGAIQPGSSGTLLWDEPEVNLNPKLLQILVEILLELSRNGQQIILATHDYVLLKWLDLLMDKGKGDEVIYHSLYRNTDSKEIVVESYDRYQDINQNSISDAFAEIYDRDVSRALGV